MFSGAGTDYALSPSVSKLSFAIGGKRRLYPSDKNFF
jgi:hypothetical protein